MYKTFYHWLSLYFIVRFMEKKLLKVLRCFYPFFSQTYEVAKLTKLYLDVSDIIHKNEHTKYAKCGLPVNFWIFLLMSFSFMTKKDHFKQNLLLWLRVLFNKVHSIIGKENYFIT